MSRNLTSYSDKLNAMQRPSTKIICTLGPATESFEAIQKLYLYGMSIARINMSHGTYESHCKAIENIRLIEKEHNSKIFIALDTKGPEFRIKCKNPLDIKENDIVSIIASEEYPNSKKKEISVNITSLNGFAPGSIISLDDDKLRLKITECNERELHTMALGNHILEDRKRISFQDFHPEGPFLSDGDERDIRFAMEKGLDAIFCSFIESADDLISIRKLVTDPTMQIIAKIESKRAVKNIKEISEVSDGIMIARGDLMNDVSAERLFSTQKKLTDSVRDKPVIMATELLQSMTKSKSPYRAEVSDVGNAVADGCSALMLSGETSIGEYPDLSVDMLRKICIDAEDYLKSKKAVPEVSTIEYKDNSYRSSMLQRSIYFFNIK